MSAVTFLTNQIPESGHVTIVLIKLTNEKADNSDMITTSSNDRRCLLHMMTIFICLKDDVKY